MIVCLDDIFQASFTLNELINLNIVGINDSRTEWNMAEIRHSEQLSEAMCSGYLESLQEVSISDEHILSFNLQNVKRISFFSEDVLDKIATAVAWGRFPALHTVCLHCRFKAELYQEPVLGIK